MLSLVWGIGGRRTLAAAGDVMQLVVGCASVQDMEISVAMGLDIADSGARRDQLEILQGSTGPELLPPGQ